MHLPSNNILIRKSLKKPLIELQLVWGINLNVTFERKSILTATLRIVGDI